MASDDGSSIKNNSAFWLAVIASVSALIITLFKLCSKSLCTEVNCCWGSFIVRRNAELETEIRELEISQGGVPESPRTGDP